MSAERSCRDACAVAAVAFVAATIGALFLPFEKGDKSLFSLFLMDAGDRTRIVGVVGLAAIPIAFALVTALSLRGDGPGPGLRVLGIVMALPFVGLAGLAAVSVATEHIKMGNWSYAAFALVAIVFVAFVRSFFGGGAWQKWAHTMIAPPMACLAVFCLVMSDASVYKRARLVGIGANLTLAAAGILVPLALYILIPRRTVAR